MKLLENKDNKTNMEIYNYMLEVGMLPKAQNKACLFFGVGESTINAWVNYDKFTEQARKLMLCMIFSHELMETNDTLIQEKNSTAQVNHEGKILLIKRNEVIAVCNDKKHSDFICDFIC